MLSEHDTTKADGEQEVEIKRYVNHPDYKKPGGVPHDNDFALVELKVEIQYFFKKNNLSFRRKQAFFS